MNCPSEYLRSLYADSELTEFESREVRIHIELCDRCRTSVENLIEENRLLSRLLQDDCFTPLSAAPISHTAARMLLPMAISVLALATFIRIALTLLNAVSLPSALNWLNPFDVSGQINLSLSSIAYVLQEGIAMVTSLVSTAAFMTVNVVLMVVVFRLLRRRITAAVLTSLTLVLVFSASPSYSAEIRRSDGTVTVATGETVDNTLVAAGDSIVVDGTINGDLIAFGRHVIVRGTVKGDIIGFAQTVEISGSVEGNVFGFAQNVQLRGNLQKNMYGFGQSVEVGDQAIVGGGVTAMGATTNIEGTVRQDAMTFSETTNVHGNVARNLDVYSQRVTVFSGAQVGGDFNATVRRADAVQVLPGSTITGKQGVHVRQPEPSRYSRVSFYFWQILWVIAAFITGLLIFWLIPALATVPLDTGTALLRAGGIGFLFLIATPVAVVILAITIIGLPIALTGLTLWLLFLYLSKIVIAQFIGRAVLGTSAASLLAGLAFIAVGINVPFVGGIVNVLLTLVGFGAILLQLRPLMSKSAESA